MHPRSRLCGGRTWAGPTGGSQGLAGCRQEGRGTPSPRSAQMGCNGVPRARTPQSAGDCVSSFRLTRTCSSPCRGAEHDADSRGDPGPQPWGLRTELGAPADLERRAEQLYPLEPGSCERGKHTPSLFLAVVLAVPTSLLGQAQPRPRFSERLSIATSPPGCGGPSTRVDRPCGSPHITPLLRGFGTCPERTVLRRVLPGAGESGGISCLVWRGHPCPSRKSL